MQILKTADEAMKLAISLLKNFTFFPLDLETDLYSHVLPHVHLLPIFPKGLEKDRATQESHGTSHGMIKYSFCLLWFL